MKLRLFVPFSLACLLSLTPAIAAELELAPIEVDARSLKNDWDHGTWIDSESIESTESRDIGNVLRQKSGVDYRLNVSGLTGFSIRGSQSEHVLVLIDGVRVNDPSSPNRAFDFSRLNPALIESIEIIKGPASVAYGSDALGGVVLIRTKGRASSLLELDLQGGSYGTLRGSATSSRTYTKNFSLFSQVSYERASGPSQAKVVNGEDDETSNLNTSLGIKAETDDSKTFFELSGSMNRNQQEIDDDSFTDDLNYEGQSDQWAVRTKIRRLWEGKQETTLLGGFVATSRDYTDQLGGGDTFDGSEYHQGRTYQAELIHNVDLSSLSDGAEVMAGAEWNGERYKQTSPTATSDVPWVSQYQIAPFAQLTARLSPSVQLVGGGRFVTNDINETAFTDRASLQFRVDPTSYLELKTGSGFKSPSLYQIYSPTYGNTNLKNERSRSFSLGYESGSFSTAVFQTDYQDMMGYDSTTFRTINVGEARVRGFESEIRVPVTQSITIAPHYTYLSARDLTKNRDLAGRSRHKGGARLRYFQDRFQFSVELLAKSDRFDDTRFPRAAGYAVVNLSAEYFVDSLKQFAIHGRVDNLFDRDYMEKVGYTSPGLSGYLGIRYQAL